MAPKTGKYELTKDENFVAYLVAIGTSEDRAKQFEGVKATLEIAVENNKNLKLISEMNGHRTETNLVIGEEVDEKLHNSTIKSTTTATEDSFTVASKGSVGSGTRVYKFSGSELVVTCTSDKGATAKLFYKLIK